MSSSPATSVRKKILFVIGSMSGGGAERRLLELLKHLDRERFEPQLWLAYRRGELLEHVPADVPIFAAVEGATEQTLTARIAGKLRLLSEWRGRQLHHHLRAQPVDLVFSWSLRMAYETALATRRLPVARIAYCVAEPSIEYRDDFLATTPWKWRLARWSYASAHRVYVNSRGNQQAITEFYNLPPDQVELCVNLRDFTQLDQQIAASPIVWPADGARLLAVGRLHLLKGLSILLEALALLVHQHQRKASLLLVGQGPEEASLRAQAIQLNIADRVGFCGFQANPGPYYQAADLFVLPSLTEGFPNCLLEALALRTPVIAADCPTGPREMLQNGAWGRLVPPGDAHILADAIVQTLDDLPMAQVRAQLAQSGIRSHHDIASGIRALEDRLLNVIVQTQQRTQRS